MSNYNEESIEILEGLDPVRKRPGMYIGSTGSKGLHHLVYEVVDNSIDEALEGHCDEIVVTLHANGSASVGDNGRGMPVGVNKKIGFSTERAIFTILHSGGKFNNDSYAKSGGLHGVGVSVVNALSSELEVVIKRDGNIYRDAYENGGHPSVKLVKGVPPIIGKTTETGTTVTFKPDESIFDTVIFNAEILKKRIKELAYLNKGLKLIFIDEAIDETTIFKEDEGLIGYMKELNTSKKLLFKDIIHLEGTKDNVDFELVMQFTQNEEEKVVSFCNNINTIEGGTHVSGLRTALTRTINQYAREIGKLKDKDANFEGRDVRGGLVAILSIKHPNPQFEGQTKTKLGNSDARGIVDELLSSESLKYFDRNIEVLKKVIDNAIKSVRIRKSEEKVRDNINNKTLSLDTKGKLSSCSSKDPKKTEIYLVEGDSAGGSAKQGRDRKTQAILPLKGKILNVEKASLGKILEHEEIKSMITAFGCGIGSEFDIKKLKYDKIVIMTDADIDGAHIRTLILTFLFRFMPDLILEGKIYFAMPPLVKITEGKKEKYLYEEAELNKYIQSKKQFTVQRYKGLGEMNPEQLWDTTMNPKTRTLKQVQIDDIYEADAVTEMLMGKNVPLRRKFIEDNSKEAELDI